MALNLREQTRAILLLRRWRDFIKTRDTSNPAFAATYTALTAETDDFLSLDADPPRAGVAQQRANVAHDARNGSLETQSLPLNSK
jgi:hypothetical protein